MWYWYVAKKNELMVDIDESANAPLRKLVSAGRRLRGALSAKALSVLDVWLYPSAQEKHYHLIVRLDGKMDECCRHIWELYLRNDVYRSCNNLMRGHRLIGAPDLLISDRKWEGFYRTHDCECFCKTKHDRATMNECSAVSVLRGCNPEFFGRPGRAVKWNFGKWKGLP